MPRSVSLKRRRRRRPCWPPSRCGPKTRANGRRKPNFNLRRTRVSSIAIVFGVLLSILGVVVYGLAEVKSITALIPTFFGIALILLGLLARKEAMRMHAMHVAALLGLFGFFGGTFMGVR